MLACIYQGTDIIDDARLMEERLGSIFQKVLEVEVFTKRTILNITFRF